MSIATPPQTRVRFTGRNGTDEDRSAASAALTIGTEYTVLFIQVGPSDSRVTLNENPRTPFNTVLFENLVIPPEVLARARELYEGSRKDVTGRARWEKLDLADPYDAAMRNHAIDLAWAEQQEAADVEYSAKGG